MDHQWDDTFLCTLPYYHGYLPREDIQDVLKQHGDFVVRSTEIIKQGKDSAEADRRREVVISVFVDPDNACKDGLIDKEVKEQMVRNIVVQQIKNKITIDGEKQFDDLPDLVRYYHHVQIRVDKGAKVVSLMRGVPLCRWEYYHKDVTIGKLLGKGAFGEVHRGNLKRRRKKNVTVAVKSLSAAAGTRELVNSMMREARLMRCLCHPNIVRIYGVAVCQQPMYIILELVKGGGLDAYLKKNAATLEKDEKLQMIMGACWGLAFLHRGQILHRDVAARNCLYDDDKNVKISDFGLSRTGTMYKIKTATKLPVKWMAPETISTHVFSQKTDVYSFGVLVYEIFACKESYEDITNAESRANIKAAKFNEFPESTPKALVQYVQEKMWDKDPSKRANMQHIQLWLETFTGLSLIIPNDVSETIFSDRDKRAKKEEEAN